MTLPRLHIGEEPWSRSLEAPETLLFLRCLPHPSYPELLWPCSWPWSLPSPWTPFTCSSGLLAMSHLHADGSSSRPGSHACCCCYGNQHTTGWGRGHLAGAQGVLPGGCTDSKTPCPLRDGKMECSSVCGTQRPHRKDSCSSARITLQIEEWPLKVSKPSSGQPQPRTGVGRAGASWE